MARGPDPDITDIDILKIFVGSREPAFVPSEIADDLDVTTEGARHQMEKLVERGLLGKKKPGQRTVLYWITDDGYEYYTQNA
jgi:predicted transcriptional regulator